MPLVGPLPGLNVNDLRHPEYLLRKYGKQQETLPEPIQVNDLYCTVSLSRPRNIYMLTFEPTTQSHITLKAV